MACVFCFVKHCVQAKQLDHSVRQSVGIARGSHDLVLAGV